LHPQVARPPYRCLTGNLPVNWPDVLCHGDLLPVKVEGKAVPLQAWIGPEGSRKLRFPDFMRKIRMVVRLSA
jgi:hypothetical protein